MMNTADPKQRRRWWRLGALVACAVLFLPAGQGLVGRWGPCGGPGFGINLLRNADFCLGLQDWTTFPDPSSDVQVESHQGGPAARLDAGDVVGCSFDWCLKLAQIDQGLKALAPATIYSLSFDAEPAAGTPRIVPELYLKDPADADYYGYIWLRPFNLSPGPHRYTLNFITPDDLPDLSTDPRQRSVHLDFNAGLAGTTLWIDDAVLEPANPLTLGGEPLIIGSFEEGESWYDGAFDTLYATDGARSLKLTAPPNGTSTFAYRIMPIDLGDRPFEQPPVSRLWDMTFRVCTDHPERIGRMYVVARTAGTLYSWRSFSGLKDECNEVILRKEDFFKQIFNTGVNWGDVRTIGIKLETNGAGVGAVPPDDGSATVWVDGLTVHPRPGPTADLIESMRPPLVRKVNVKVGATQANFTWETDENGDTVVECRSGSAYQEVFRSNTPVLVHSAAIARAASTTYDCRVSSTDVQGNRAVSGAFRFTTEPSVPPFTIPPDTLSYPIGLGVVSLDSDQPLAAAAGFNAVHTYLYGGCQSNHDSLTQQYLQGLATNQLRGLVQLLCTSDVYDDTVPLANLMIPQRVALFTGSPSLSRVLGYYFTDEPELNCKDTEPPPAPHCTVRRVTEVYTAIDSADSLRTVFSGTTDLKTNPFIDTFQTANFDNYPIPVRPVSTMIVPLEEARESTKPFHFAYQAYSIELDRNWPAETGVTRYPSGVEMRVMAYLGIIYGARGVWAHAQSEITPHPGTEWHWADLASVARELRRIEPVLGSSTVIGDYGLSATQTAVKYFRKEYANKRYLIAANSGTTSVTVTFSLDNAEKAPVKELIDGTSVPVTHKNFQAQFPPLGVHVFEITKK